MLLVDVGETLWLPDDVGVGVGVIVSVTDGLSDAEVDISEADSEVLLETEGVDDTDVDVELLSEGLDHTEVE